MTTLVAPITASSDAIVVSAPLTAQPYPFGIAIEDERLTVRGGGGTTTLYVNRGQDGTTAAAHAGGVTVTSGWSSGGGSISASGSVAGSVAGVTTATLLGTVSGSGGDAVQSFDFTTDPLVISVAMPANTPNQKFIDVLDPNLPDMELSVTGSDDGAGNGTIAVNLASSGDGMSSLTLSDDNGDGLVSLHTGAVNQIYVRTGTGTALLVGVGAGTVRFRVDADGHVYMFNLPASDPGVSGALYSDGTPSAGVPKALMVSGG